MNSSYLHYLPAVYQRGAEQGQGPFLGDYLKVFEKILTGIEGDSQLEGRKGVQQLLSAEVIGNLFYPRFSFLFDGKQQGFIPPISALPGQQKTAILEEFNRYIGIETEQDPLSGYIGDNQQTLGWQVQFEVWVNDLVSWLGSWVNLVVNEHWALDKKRTVVAEILALYRLRGTAFGLLTMLNLILDLPITIDGFEYDEKGKTTPVKGELKIDVQAPKTPSMVISDSPNRTFVLQQRYSTGMEVVSGFAPWMFCIYVILPSKQTPSFIMTSDAVHQVLSLIEQLNLLVERLKPANSRFTVSVQPSMQLIKKGYATNLGNNTLLGEE